MERVTQEQAILGEGPIWDEQANVLWWIDIVGKKLFKLDPSSGENSAFDLPEKPGTVVIAADGRLVLALKSGFHWFDPQTQELTFISDPDRDEPETRFNEGKCDPAGRFWAGTMEDAETGKHIGSLFSLQNDQCTKHLTGIGVSNGIVWNNAADTMYYIDSPTRNVDAFDYDQASGTITNRRTVFKVTPEQGYPDGMSIDSDDNLWICLWHGWSLIQADPRNGQLLRTIKVPVRNVTACAFGGENLQDLYITTARKGNTDVELEQQPDAGGLFHTTVDAVGTTFAKFAG